MLPQGEGIKLPKLNLPDIEPRLSQRDGRLWVFDILRKKDLVLTPEEWVRQHWISFLIKEQSYPKGLLSLEKGLKYNQLQKRTDLLVYNKSGNVHLLIECKAPNVSLSQKTVEQACLYHSQLQSEYLILSNGMNHLCLQWILDEKRFEQIKSFPPIPN